MIDKLREHFQVAEICHALSVSRSGYYAACSRRPSPRSIANQKLLQAVQTIHAHRHTRSYGSPRVTRELRNHGLTCTENRIARLMRKHHIAARPRKPFRPKTTSPDHAAHPSPNLLASAGPPDAPGLQLVSDITYIPTAQGWLYLAVVVDLFTRAILGWKLSESLHSDVVTGALRSALSSGIIQKNAIFHSDRGSQYSSSKTRKILIATKLRQSMSAKGYCYDNAFAESTFASIKSDILPDNHSFPSKATDATAIFDYIETFYNRRRLHSSLGYVSPFQFLKQHFHSSKQSLN